MAGPEAALLSLHPVYETVRTVGRGQKTFVQCARNRLTGERVAIKFIPRGGRGSWQLVLY